MARPTTKELMDLINAQNDKIASLEHQLSNKQEETTEDDDETGQVSLKGIYHDEDKGIRIELDWNKKFIKYLKKNGFDGFDEEEIVQKWLAFLLKDIEKNIGDRDDRYQ